MATLDLSTQQREELWQMLTVQLESHYQESRGMKVAPDLDLKAIKDLVRKFSVTQSNDPKQAIQHVIDGLKEFTVHTTHPGYYGLFNPRSNFAGIAADLITAVFNPQMAAWSHAPFSAEVEHFLVEEVGKNLGLAEVDGVFASGGAEANSTAVLCALNDQFEHFTDRGLLGLKEPPVLYTSIESHHSITRAARNAGLGDRSVRLIEVDGKLRMDAQVLKQTIEADLDLGMKPFMLAATAGTTGSGAIDDLVKLGDIARQFDMWFHVDAAYGGALMAEDQLMRHLKGIQQADSITFDVHKWFSVPMAASMFISSNTAILEKAFRMTNPYMPKEARDLEIVDPFNHSIQWSRRFIGLKFYMTLLIYGWQGIRETVLNQIKIGDLLRKYLIECRWQIENETVMPIICFRKQDLTNGQVQEICDAVVKSGKVWISTYPIKGQLCLRACITNYLTEENDLKVLIDVLEEAYQKTIK
ncbi:MAG: aminotransferase class V-fold PLP-dependent enzyme [Cyclobacteriaceae bacterium]